MDEMGIRVRDRREALRFSQRALAKKAKVSAAFVQRLEAGKRDQISTPHLGRVADVLGVSVDYLRTGAESQTESPELEELTEQLLASTDTDLDYLTSEVVHELSPEEREWVRDYMRFMLEHKRRHAPGA